MRQRALDADVFVVLPILVLGLAPGAAGDDGTVVENQDVLRIASMGRCSAADVGDEIAGDALVGPEMKTHSACVAANSRPRLDEPAWYSTGVRCSDGSDR